MNAELLITGLPHFVAANDKYNPSAIFNDIETDRRQKEINEYVKSLSKFSMGSICVESSNQELLDQRYSQFLNAGIPQTHNEIDQIVFRLAAQKDLSKIYACDFDLPMDEFNLPKEVDFQAWQSEFDRTLKKLYEDGLEPVIKFFNQTESNMSEVYKGMLLYGDETAQGTLLKWYKRNLVILRKVMTTPSPGPKALFIGAGHVPFITGLASSLGISIENMTNLK